MSTSPASAVMTSNFGPAANPLQATLDRVRNWAGVLITLTQDEKTGGHFKILDGGRGANGRLHIVYNRPATIGLIETGLRAIANRAIKSQPLKFDPRGEFTLRPMTADTIEVSAIVRQIDEQGRTREGTTYHQVNFLILKDERFDEKLGTQMTAWLTHTVKRCPDMDRKVFQYIFSSQGFEPSGLPTREA